MEIFLQIISGIYFQLAAGGAILGLTSTSTEKSNPHQSAVTEVIEQGEIVLKLVLRCSEKDEWFFYLYVTVVAFVAWRGVFRGQWWRGVCSVTCSVFL